MRLANDIPSAGEKSLQRENRDEQVEVLSLLGDVAEKNEIAKVHSHVVVGKRDGTAHGGHLLRATVRPILEVILTESPQYLAKRHAPESGLALISLS